MLRLKNKYKDKFALLIMGGPSILENKYDLTSIDKGRYIVFLETKALTPQFLNFGLNPDFYFMPFSEKCKDNALQNFILRSFLAQIDIRPFIKKRYVRILEDMKNNFDAYFEFWKPEKSPHKRYRWKPDIYMKDSPYEILGRIPHTKIIAEEKSLSCYFPHFKYANPLYFYESLPGAGSFDIEKYYNLVEQDTKAMLPDNIFLNAAAIAFYPLLYFMGFRKVYLVGMDMSMLGSMEYAALYTFKSMLHYRWFFYRARHVFNAKYKSNRPFYLRPKSEFTDLKTVMCCDKMEFINIYEPFRFARPLEGIRNISFEEFLHE